MVELPGKDTIEAVEKRIGKPLIKLLLFVVTLAIIVIAGGFIVNGLRSSFTWLQPYLPQFSFPGSEAILPVATVLVYVLVAIGALLVYRKIQKLTKQAEDAVGREGAALNAIVESENKIAALDKQVKTLIGRLEYMEKKVGGELEDILVKQFMEQADKKFITKPAEEPPAAPNSKVELGRKLLREAAQELRYAFKEPLSWDSGATISRGWLSVQVTKLIKDILSPDTLDDFRIVERAIEEKRKVREQSADAKEHAAKIIEFLETLADGLTNYDLDDDIDLPPSFEKFRKDHGG